MSKLAMNDLYRSLSDEDLLIALRIMTNEPNQETADGIESILDEILSGSIGEARDKWRKVLFEGIVLVDIKNEIVRRFQEVICK